MFSYETVRCKGLKKESIKKEDLEERTRFNQYARFPDVYLVMQQ